MNPSDPFRWHENGDYGLTVEHSTSSTISHEVLYEDEVTHLKERTLFIGAAIPPRRFYAFGVLIAALIVLLVGRAGWMQLIRGGEFRVLADNNRFRHEVVPARRGIIRDRNGAVLAENVPSFDVRVIERQLPRNAADREDALGRLSRILGTSITDLEGAFTSSTDPDESLVLQRDIPYDRAVAVKILSADISAIEVAIGSKRRYIGQEVLSFSHILGYVAGISDTELKVKRELGYRQVDVIGKTGIESSYEAQLRGRSGEKIFEVDAQHRVTATVGETPAIDGEDIYLTIDADLQVAAEKALRDELVRAKVERGSVIALNPQDGSILAAVSLPAYDDNLFSGTVSSTAYKELLNNPSRPLFPRAWAGTYPSGSTIKPVIATAALTEHIVTPQTTVLSTGGLQVGPWFFPDWKNGGHGLVNVRSAIAWSVNTFFYYVGGGYNSFVGLGVDRLADWMHRFGLGSKTGIDVPGEASGFVPSQEWKNRVKHERWFVGDTYNLSIGQGDLLVTPLQVAAFTATVANGGYLVVPHFGMKHGSASSTGDMFSFSRPQTAVAPEDVIQTVRLGMRDTVIYGSGRALSVLPFAVAGKTGTAQWRADKPNHGWFTSFAPFDHPEIVVTVLIEEGAEGSLTAVPVAKEVLEAWYRKQRAQH